MTVVEAYMLGVAAGQRAVEQGVAVDEDTMTRVFAHAEMLVEKQDRVGPRELRLYPVSLRRDEVGDYLIVSGSRDIVRERIPAREFVCEFMYSED